MLLTLFLTILIGFAVTESKDTKEKFEGYVVSVEPDNSTGYTSIKILDMAGTGHEINMSSSDFKNKGIRLGDHVSVSIVRDVNGNIKKNQTEINEVSVGTSGETIQGVVTNVNNSVPAGTSELTIKDKNGNEQIVKVPIYQGENLKPGDKVSIKVVGKAEGIIGSISSVENAEDSEENEDKDSHALPEFRGLLALFSVLGSAIYRRQA